MKFIRGMVDSILYVLVFCVLALTVPRAFGFQYITIQSGSMLPVLEVGSACVISPDRDGYKHLTRQDIITYELEGQDVDGPLLITHRVQCINGDGTYTTKGDNNDVADSRRVEKSQIIGVVRFHIPYFGYVLDNLNSSLAKGILAAVMVALVVLSLLLDPGEPKKEEVKGEDPQALKYRRQAHKKPAAMGMAARKREAEGPGPGEVGLEVSVDTGRPVPAAVPKAKKKAGGTLTLEEAMSRKQGRTAISATPADAAFDGFPEVPGGVALEDLGAAPAAAKPVVKAARKKASTGAISLEEAMRRKAAMGK